MTLDEFLILLADEIVNPIIALLFAVALLVFLWGVFQYIKGSDNPEQRKTGTQHIIWGLIGLSIMVSAYAIINIALNTFGIRPPGGML